MQVFDESGSRVLLGALLATRGEGSVYLLPDLPDSVAKIYHKPTPERSDKLRAMVGVSGANPGKLAAWPRQTLHAPGSDAAVGFLMPRIANAEEVHVLYGPRSRKERFPNATWEFLVHTAANIARSFAAMHENGYVVGDVNHGNLLVTQNATVALIDCDSFHLCLGGRLFPCGVGVSTHTPPELQDKNLSQSGRTANHDCFGLAVLLFQTLFMGRHPFSGRFLGGGDMPIETAIKEYRFAYGAGATARQMQPPPGTLPLAATTETIACLFNRAFARQSLPLPRPPAREWVTALENLGRNLCACPVNPGHVYSCESAVCPWCEIESAANTMLFYIPAGSAVSTPAIEELWGKITAVSAPEPAPRLPRTQLVGYVLPPDVQELAAKKRNLLFYTLNRRAVDDAVAPLQARYEQALSDWSDVADAWNYDSGYGAFQVRLTVAKSKVREYNAVDEARLRELQQLSADQERLQRERFFDGFSLRDSAAEGINAARIATLNSYGVYTAKDVVAGRIRLVPGFGSALTTRLMEWRRGIEAQFVFVPEKQPDRRDIEQIENRAYTMKIKMAQSLLSVPDELRRIKDEIIARRIALGDSVRRKSSALAKAEAHWNAVK